MIREDNARSPRVTVVITTHNRLQWLKQCVESVICQQGVSWELIVIDDASSDQTWSWLAEITHTQIRLHRFEQNHERCLARNKGLAMARGRYVMFLDDDDWLWADALSLLSNSLDENPDANAVIGARWAVFTEEGYERRDAHPRRGLKRNVLDELLFGWSSVSGQNLYRTDIIRSVGGFEEPKLIPCEDRLLWMRVAMMGSVIMRPETVMSYRFHAGQARPVDIRLLREQVAHRIIRSLPKSTRRKALKLRRSGRLIEEAVEQMSSGSPLLAVWLVGKAVLNTPGIFTSVLIGEWVIRRLLGRAYRRMQKHIVT